MYMNVYIYIYDIIPVDIICLSWSILRLFDIFIHFLILVSTSPLNLGRLFDDGRNSRAHHSTSQSCWLDDSAQSSHLRCLQCPLKSLYSEPHGLEDNFPAGNPSRAAWHQQISGSYSENRLFALKGCLLLQTSATIYPYIDRERERHTHIHITHYILHTIYHICIYNHHI